MGRNPERLFALFDPIPVFHRLARQNLAKQSPFDHAPQSRQSRGLVRIAVCILHPKCIRDPAVLGCVTARIHNIRTDQSQCSGQTRKNARMVLHHETNTCRIPIFIRVQINANILFTCPAKQFGKRDMRRDMQTLPIRIIVTCDFGLHVLTWPVLQCSAQRLLGLCSSVVTVQRFHAIPQRALGLAIQRPDQNRLPIVPGVRTNAANIANRQHTQQI